MFSWVRKLPGGRQAPEPFRVQERDASFVVVGNQRLEVALAAGRAAGARITPTLPIENMRIPKLELMRHFGLDAASEAVLVSADRGVVVARPWVHAQPVLGLAEALAIAIRLADEARGLVLDPMAGGPVPEHIRRDVGRAVEKHSPAPFIRVLASIDAAGVGLVTTLGLERFGAFPLRVRDVPRDLVHATTRLAGAVAQRLIRLVPDTDTWDVPRVVGIVPDALAQAKRTLRTTGEACSSGCDRVPTDFGSWSRRTAAMRNDG